MSIYMERYIYIYTHIYIYDICTVYIGSCPKTVFLREGNPKQRSLSHSGHFPQVPEVEKPKKTAKISRISPVFQVDCFLKLLNRSQT